MEKPELRRLLIAEISNEWAKNHKAVLLAALGERDEGVIAQGARDLKISLRRFIDAELNDEVKIIQHSRNKAVIAAIPAASAPEDQQQIDEALDQLFGAAASRSIWVTPQLWSAFRSLPAAGSKRYAVLSGVSPAILDLPSEEKSPDESFEIEEHWISDALSCASDTEKYQAIKNWADDAGIDLERFALPREKGDRSSLPTRGRRLTLLELLLSTLKEDELRRIDIPLDLVERLHNVKSPR